MLNQKRILFALFFLSGFCGLLYQVVWLRMSFASFGVITPVLSVVISVFMFGLFAGSWFAGRQVERLTRKSGFSAIWFYALAELFVGVGAFAVPYLFGLGEKALLPVGQSDSVAYLLWSGLIIAGSIFPWCFFMGTTFPLMMAYMKEQSKQEKTSFSFLYLANVIGAMAGTLVTAVVLIEFLGFRGTLRFAAAANLLVGGTAAFLGLGGLRGRRDRKEVGEVRAQPLAGPTVRRRNGSTMIILFTTGFTSMAMEVVWTRAFTVVLKTQVYSFAFLLFTYLLATWVGSLLYRKHLNRRMVVSTGQLIAWLAIAGLLPIALNDPRIHALNIAPLLGSVLGGFAALASIFPFCALLGYLTPKLIDEGSNGNPEEAGVSYAVNILGCIVGPLVASYLILPAMGIKAALLFLAAPYTVLYLVGFSGSYTLREHRKEAFALVLLLFVSVTVVRTYENQGKGYQPGENVVRRDHTATIVSFGSGMDKKLLVNGIGITNLTTITKVMAHLPLAVLAHKPTSALAICFGMGTTFRSLMSWNIAVTVVELVPSVREAFPFYFDDAKELMNRPNGRIVIDDGRRFLRRTQETFDVITLDPPPPVEAAGSSLLYSKEFYAAVKARLKEGGILQQWMPNTKGKTVQAVVNSLNESFPYVKMFLSHEGWGHHFLASMSPIDIPSPEVMAGRMPDAAKADLGEWVKEKDPRTFLGLVVGSEEDPRAFVRDAGPIQVTDDHPYNEYYLMRTLFAALKVGDSTSEKRASVSP
jgi:spermidine synthase/MFS family permease